MNWYDVQFFLSSWAGGILQISDLISCENEQFSPIRPAPSGRYPFMNSPKQFVRVWNVEGWLRSYPNTLSLTLCKFLELGNFCMCCKFQNRIRRNSMSESRINKCKYGIMQIWHKCIYANMADHSEGPGLVAWKWGQSVVWYFVLTTRPIHSVVV